jgi:hypothetical protein
VTATNPMRWEREDWLGRPFCGGGVVLPSHRRFSGIIGAAGAGATTVALIAVVTITLVLGGGSSNAGASDAARSAPDACRVLSASEAGQILKLPTSSQAFTDLGFAVSGTTTPDPTYSQCRFTSPSSRSQIRVIINASLAKAPSLRIQAITARIEPGGRGLTIDRIAAVWLPWTQQDLRGQGGSLTAVEDGDYIAVSLIYVHGDAIGAAEDAMRLVLPRISSSH